jgi:hypothetical protein
MFQPTSSATRTTPPCACGRPATKTCIASCIRILKTLENDPAVRARADAFAAFLTVLVDRIHELDPNHPVIYRDAEDVYLPRLKQASWRVQMSFEATGVARPWLVSGANVYAQARLQQIDTNWPSQWLDGPLIISEFAPSGVGPAERPIGFQQDWAIIRSRPGITGAASPCCSTGQTR